MKRRRERLRKPCSSSVSSREKGEKLRRALSGLISSFRHGTTTLLSLADSFYHVLRGQKPLSKSRKEMNTIVI